MPNIPLAKRLIALTADLCVTAGVTAERHAEYVARRDGTIKPKSDPITSSTEELLKGARSKIAEQLKKAEEEAAKHDYVKARTLLEDVVVKSNEASELKDADNKYKTRLGIVESAVAGLTTVTPAGNDPVIGADITGINQKISRAKQETAKPKPDYANAMKLLDDAETDQQAAGVMKKMKANNAPTEGELTALMSKPGGIKMLDQIVAGLGPDAKQEVLLRAMKVRFGLEAATSIAAGAAGSADVEEAPTTMDSDLSLKKIYTLLTKVPDKHIKGNPSFKKIKRYAGSPGEAGKKAAAKGDYYEPTGKEVVLSVGSPDVYPYTLQDPAELPDVTDPKCKPVDNVPPKHFDNNTLHEAAHAIDDKKGFMKRKGSDPAYGGWLDHGKDVMPAAVAAAQALKYDAGYIAKYLLGETVTTEPPPPAETAQDAWNEARDKAKAWADAIRNGQNPWAKGTQCKTAITGGGFVIGDRIYHEAYAGTWVSYLAASRKQGVTGYQFRAAGEWFAELYASYGNRKLKKTHPAVTLFLGKMFPLNPPLV